MTGASSGIGLETVRSLVSHGASVVGAVRDLAKAEAAATSIRGAASQAGGSLKLIELDLASLRSIRASADQLMTDGQRFDAIIAHAGRQSRPFAVHFAQCITAIPRLPYGFCRFHSALRSMRCWKADLWRVPVTEGEVDVFEASFADLLDDMFGHPRGYQTIASTLNIDRDTGGSRSADNVGRVQHVLGKAKA